MPPKDESQPSGGTAVAPATDTSTPEQTDHSPAPDTGSGEDGGEPTTPTPKATPGVVTKGGLKLPIAKPRSRFSERIGDLVEQRRQRDEEIRQLRDRVSKYEGPDGQPITRGTVGKQPGKRTDGLTPGADIKPEDYETYGQYVEALVERTIENAAQRREGQAGESAMLRHRQERMDSFQEAAAPLLEQHGDAFMEAISDPDLPISEAMADAVLELDEIGPFVMLYLANNPKESLKMVRMNPRAATVAIGRLASKLDYEIRQGGQGQPGAEQPTGDGAEPAPPPAPVRPAPSTVPTPRGGSPTSLEGMPNDKMDTKAWMIAEAARLRAKYGQNTRSWVPK